MPPLANSVDPHQQTLAIYSGIRGDHCATFLSPVFALLAFLNQRWAFLFVPIGYLALQAVMALVVDDLACWLDCTDLALFGAGLARGAAVGAPPKPVEDPKSGEETQRGA